MENREVKYYTGSNGDVINIATMETTHLSHSLAKKYREVFDAKDKDDFNRRIKAIEDLKEEMYFRFNNYYSTLDKGE